MQILLGKSARSHAWLDAGNRIFSIASKAEQGNPYIVGFRQLNGRSSKGVAWPSAMSGLRSLVQATSRPFGNMTWQCSPAAGVPCGQRHEFAGTGKAHRSRIPFRVMHCRPEFTVPDVRMVNVSAIQSARFAGLTGFNRRLTTVWHETSMGGGWNPSNWPLAGMFKILACIESFAPFFSQPVGFETRNSSLFAERVSRERWCKPPCSKWNAAGPVRSAREPAGRKHLESHSPSRSTKS